MFNRLFDRSPAHRGLTISKTMAERLSRRFLSDDAFQLINLNNEDSYNPWRHLGTHLGKSPDKKLCFTKGRHGAPGPRFSPDIQRVAQISEAGSHGTSMLLQGPVPLAMATTSTGNWPSFRQSLIWPKTASTPSMNVSSNHCRQPRRSRNNLHSQIVMTNEPSSINLIHYKKHCTTNYNNKLLITSIIF